MAVFFLFSHIFLHIVFVAKSFTYKKEKINMKNYIYSIAKALTFGKEITGELTKKLKTSLPEIVKEALNAYEWETDNRIFDINSDILNKSFMTDVFIYEVDEKQPENNPDKVYSVSNLIPWTTITADIRQNTAGYIAEENKRTDLLVAIEGVSLDSVFEHGYTVPLCYLASIGYHLEDMYNGSSSVAVRTHVAKYLSMYASSLDASVVEELYNSMKTDVPCVKVELARQHLFEDELVNDPDSSVKVALASKTGNQDIQKSLLQKSLECEDAKTLVALAERGLFHNVLANNPNKYVRAAVVRGSKDLELIELLAYDESDTVKCEIAKRGLATEFLLEIKEDGTYVNDRYVRAALAEYAVNNNDKPLLDILSTDGAIEVRTVCAKSTIPDINVKLLRDKHYLVRAAAMETKTKMDSEP